MSEQQQESGAPVKRYVVFAADAYYPGGGWDDHVGSFDTVEEAIRAGEAAGCDAYHVIDLWSGRHVRRG